MSGPLTFDICESDICHCAHSLSLCCISGYSLEEESERFTSLRKIILHRLLSLIGVMHLCNHSFIPIVAMKRGTMEAQGQYTNLKPILSPTWGNHSN
eukprot:1156257-Amphidinium_carterae.1